MDADWIDSSLSEDSKKADDGPIAIPRRIKSGKSPEAKPKIRRIVKDAPVKPTASKPNQAFVEVRNLVFLFRSTFNL